MLTNQAGLAIEEYDTRPQSLKQIMHDKAQAETAAWVAQGLAQSVAFINHQTLSWPDHASLRVGSLGRLHFLDLSQMGDDCTLYMALHGLPRSMYASCRNGEHVS